MDIAADTTITLDTPVTLGTLSTQDLTTPSNSWIFAGTNSLTLDNGASKPVLDILNRFPIISAPLVGTNGFSKTGPGAVTLSGDNSGLSGTLDLPNVAGTNSAGVTVAGTNALGSINTINIGGSTTTGQFLALSGTTTVGSGVTINLNSQGGNSAPSGGLRAEGTTSEIVTINGPVNITLTGNAARIANNSAKRLDINGKITGAAGLTFRFGKNEGIHITNTGNTWSGTTVHSQEILWFEPGSLPTTTNLQLCASDAGHVQTSGSFTRALGSLANQVQFTNSAARAQGFGARGGELTLNFGGAGADVLFDTAAAPIVGTFATTNIPAGYNVVVNYDGLNQIALVSGTPYSNWETANGITAAGAAADSDNDGVSNGIEFVIGGDPSGPGSDSNSLLPTVATTETHLNFVFRRSDVSATYEPFVEYSNSLDGWATATNGTDGVVISVENDPFPSEPGIDRVTVSIPRSLAAPGSKLFARLKMVVP